MANIIFPKFITDELLNGKRIECIAMYVIILTIVNFGGTSLTDFLNGKLFVSRGIVYNKFQCEMASKILECDYSSIKNPEFWDIKERAHKFLYANGKGFGEVLNSAFNIFN